MIRLFHLKNENRIGIQAGTSRSFKYNFLSDILDNFLKFIYPISSLFDTDFFLTYDSEIKEEFIDKISKFIPNINLFF